ncbi:MAG: CDP-alcohol phosphatidyltransferase family protein [Promethearchaeota archaeon]
MARKLKNIVRNFRRGIKPQGEIVNTLLYRPLSYPFVRLAAKLKLTPNFVTGLSFLSAFLAAIFFGFGKNVYLGALFFFLHHYFDCADGALARMTKNFSKYGAMLDGIGDTVGWLGVMVAITIEQYLRLETALVFLYLGLALISNFASLLYHYSVKSRYFKHLRAGQNGEQNHNENGTLSTKTNQYSLATFFGFDNESEAKLNLFEKWAIILAPFPDIDEPLIRNSDVHEMTREEKQQLFAKSFSFLPSLWSLMAGASQITAVLIVALCNRLDDVLWIVLIIGWNLLALPLSLIHHNAIKRFKAQISHTQSTEILTHTL